MRFPVNTTKIFKTPILNNIFEGLLFQDIAFFVCLKFF